MDTIQRTTLHPHFFLYKMLAFKLGIILNVFSEGGGGGYRRFRIGPDNGLALYLWLSITWSHAAQNPCFVLLCAVGDNAIGMVGIISFFPALLSFRNSSYQSVGMDCAAQHTSWQLTNSQFVGKQDTHLQTGCQINRCLGPIETCKR